MTAQNNSASSVQARMGLSTSHLWPVHLDSQAYYKSKRSLNKICMRHLFEIVVKLSLWCASEQLLAWAGTGLVLGWTMSADMGRTCLGLSRPRYTTATVQASLWRSVRMGSLITQTVCFNGTSHMNKPCIATMGSTVLARVIVRYFCIVTELSFSFSHFPEAKCGLLCTLKTLWYAFCRWQFHFFRRDSYNCKWCHDNFQFLLHIRTEWGFFCLEACAIQKEVSIRRGELWNNILRAMERKSRPWHFIKLSKRENKQLQYWNPFTIKLRLSSSLTILKTENNLWHFM